MAPIASARPRYGNSISVYHCAALWPVSLLHTGEELINGVQSGPRVTLVPCHTYPGTAFCGRLADTEEHEFAVCSSISLWARRMSPRCSRRIWSVMTFRTTSG